MRRFRHWTPRYVLNRLALMRDERLHPDWPWLTRDAIGILRSWLHPTDSGLEFGSGRSTVWLARRVKRLVSVEHNLAWYHSVNARLEALQLLDSVVDHRLREDGVTGRDDCSYVAVARTIPPASLDFCLVDGVAREHCVVGSIDLLKPGGLLILDNANWYIPFPFDHPPPDSRTPAMGCASDAWRRVGETLSGWRNMWTTNGVSATAFWVKPPDPR